MPELPEVENVCRALAKKLVGRKLRHVQARRKDLRFPLPEGFAGKLQGKRVERVFRRAKYMIWALDDGTALLSHLGMSGRFVASKRPSAILDPHDHVLFETEDGTFIRYNDSRRFGMMDIVNIASLEEHRLLSSLGIEPLGADFNAAYLERALQGKKTNIKAALLDQRLVAGLGNIYVCEALFRAGLSPKRQARTISGDRARKLTQAIKAVLKEAIAAGGSSLRDYVQLDGELGYFQHRWRVYGREGMGCEGCDCGAGDQRSGKKKKGVGVRRLVQAGRSTFYCLKKQH